MDLMVVAMKTKVGNPLRKLVLLKLADNASDNGECWPSYQHIADQCEIGRSTVKAHIRELEKAGLLRREYRRKGELNQSNVFHLTLGGGAGAALGGGAGDNPPGAGAALGGGAGAAPRTSHSSEPVNEPKERGADAPEPVGKQKGKASNRTARFDPMTAKPENVSQEAWEGFVQMRKSKSKPLTARACQLIAKKLEGRADADSIVDRSTANSWSDVYPDPAGGAKAGKPSAYVGLPTHTPEMYQDQEADNGAQF